MQWDPQVVTHAVGLVHLFLEDKPTSGIDQLVITFIYKTLVGIDNILLYEPFTYFCEG